MANFYSIITNRGKELETEALASGSKITLVKFVVGDGNGQATPPKPTQTKLVNEKYRGDIGELSVSPDQSTQMMAKIVLPPDVGGFTVREIGILTDAGELYAVANCAAIEKPVGGVSVNMQFRLAVSDTANITLNVATGDGLFLRIDQDLLEIRGRGAQAQKTARESLAIVDASTRQKGLVQLNSATNSTSETQAATPAAVKAANDNANGRLEKNKNLSDVTDKSKARVNLELIKQTSPHDNTTGSLLTVGAFGLGGNSIPVTTASNSDLSKMPAIPFNAIREYKASDGSVYLIGISGISPSGNLVEWLAPENGADAKKIAVRNKDSLFVLYSTGNKPTASDVGAIPFFGQIPAGTNLNTLTRYGVWFNPSNANATLALNYPSTQAGSLQVLQDAGSTQIYTEYQSGSQFRRGFYAGTWSPWRIVYDSGYKPTPDDVNAIAQDSCRVAGFAGGNRDMPYMRHTASNDVVRLLPANGNAVSATKLQTARTINGVAFDGTANINISASQVGSYTKAESDSRFQLIVPASGAVGTYAYARVQSGNLNINFGKTVAASVLTPACGDGSGDAGGSLSGTWRCCGKTWGSGWPSRVTLWIRIA
ncbi:tail-collar fiber protein [Hafnia phage yong2]|uniref:phage tail-collar fiber domain-containing protein n=1 Tax=Hafnia paralvei TaxID=546367 RepID=UPI00214B3483|nr:phage tail protein [Hafnia paralvei]QXN68744.1 tail-collar fiber protein [Hafnia phage yong2]